MSRSDTHPTSRRTFLAGTAAAGAAALVGLTAPEAAAAKRFKQLLDALKPDPSKPGGGGQGGDGGDGGDGPKGGGDGIPTVAQVKMLKALQEEVNERTGYLDNLRIQKKTLSEAQQDELSRLQDDQHTIADLARDLTQPKRDDGEED